MLLEIRPFSAGRIIPAISEASIFLKCTFISTTSKGECK